jgi:hypothetical protein
MSEDDGVYSNGDICPVSEAICEGISIKFPKNMNLNSIYLDTHAIADETKTLMVEARSGLTVLICCILLMSLISILLSTWLAKTITNTPASFGSIVSHYFGFDRNATEQHLTWWTPIHVKANELIARNSSNTTRKRVPLEIPYSDYPNFHTIVLPLLFICSILLAALAYYARVKCTNRDFAWGAVPKIPLGRVDRAVAVATILKEKEAEPGVDYTIVQGTKEEPVVFTLTDTLQPLREEGDIIDEGTQYDPDDLLK